MTAFFSNPGTGPVSDASEENARSNMVVLLMDAGVVDATISLTGEGGGRYDFHVQRPGVTRVCQVAMPGLPVERVRFLNTPEQDVFDFPRLYVDGSSWLWMFAITSVQRWANTLGASDD